MTNGKLPTGRPDPADRRIYLGMPGYGQLTADAGRGFWRATRLPEEHVWWNYQAGSLAAANFNKIWCDALNVIHRGQRLDYFAMQHTDVGPPDWWLDQAIDELEANDLDVLGIVVPIKDTRGMTSLALARDDGDDWRPLCRLTMHEVHRLPPTFTSEDIGHPLLLNTGLWVCRFDSAWVTKVHFTVNDRIVFDRTSKRYMAQAEPEDWFFSRLCHELGLKIGATRKIPVSHRGEIDYRSDQIWGEPYDSGWVDESQLPATLGEPFTLPAGVDGWLRTEEGAALADLATGKTVLEIGSFCGLSTICLARTAERVFAVDTFDGRATPEPGDTLDRFLANLERYGVLHKVVERVGTLAEWVSNLSAQRFDLVFIDGAHDYESVRSDIAHARELLAPDGILAFHDYRRFAGEFDGRWDPGVTQAVDELLASGGKLLSRYASLAVVRPPALIPQALEV